MSKYFAKDNATIQITQSTTVKQFMFFGIENVVKIIRQYLYGKSSKIRIYSVPDQSIVNGHQPVIEIKGQYQDVIELEGIINGIIARGSSLATSAWRLSQATKKPIIFMGDRQDLFVNQAFDGAAV